MKIYTRTGDDGSTSLLGGERVQKDDLQIESYGTVDELNSQIGMLHDISPDGCKPVLREIQDLLFHIGSTLACSGKPDPAWGVKPIIREDIERLEAAMDQWDAELPPMTNFILPGGHPAVSQAHICRTVCRRAERRVISFARVNALDTHIVKYLNRLSDLFFVLGRWLSKELEVAEITWNPSA